MANLRDKHLKKYRFKLKRKPLYPYSGLGNPKKQAGGGKGGGWKSQDVGSKTTNSIDYKSWKKMYYQQKRQEQRKMLKADLHIREKRKKSRAEEF